MPPFTPDDFNSLTLVDAVALLRSGRLTSHELVKQSIERALAQSHLNAIAYLDESGALEAARLSDTRLKSSLPSRPLEGVPIFIKDNIHVQGQPNTAGTPGLHHFVPTEDADVVTKLRDCGAIMLGKTSMHELACGISGYSVVYRTSNDHIGVRNAYDVTRIAGGSSSGNGAALGARIVTAAIGSDTGGSVRIPAALNGVAALRPTIGRYSQRGMTPISHTRDTAGPMAQTVADLELLDRVITGDSEVVAVDSLEEVRLGMVDYFMKNMDEDTNDFMSDVVRKLTDAGVEIVPVAMPDLTMLNDASAFAIGVYEQHDDLAAYLNEFCPGITLDDLVSKMANLDARASFEKWTLPRKIPATGVSDALIDAAPAYQEAIARYRPALQQLYRNVFANHRLDGIIFPAVPCVAVKAGQDANSLENFALFAQNYGPSSVAGIPGLSLSVALGKQSDMPLSICVDGPENSDRHLLAVGMALERFFGRIPPPKHE